MHACVCMLVSYILVSCSFPLFQSASMLPWKQFWKAGSRRDRTASAVNPESHFKDVGGKLSSVCAWANIHDWVVAVAFRARVAFLGFDENITLLLSAALFALTVLGVFVLQTFLWETQFLLVWGQGNIFWHTFHSMLAREEKKNLYNCCCWIQKSSWPHSSWMFTIKKFIMFYYSCNFVTYCRLECKPADHPACLMGEFLEDGSIS